MCEWEFVYKCPAFSNLEMEDARSMFGERRRILAPLFYVVIFCEFMRVWEIDVRTKKSAVLFVLSPSSPEV